MMESRVRRVLDTPLEPVIGLAEGETRWRGMTVVELDKAQRAHQHFHEKDWHGASVTTTTPAMPAFATPPRPSR
jgi:hypothetical protein